MLTAHPYKIRIKFWVDHDCAWNFDASFAWKVYQLIQDKLELAQQPLVTQLGQHLFSNISQDDLVERNESDLYGAVLSLWHHINEKKPMNAQYEYLTQR